MEDDTLTELPCVIRSQRNKLRKTVEDVNNEDRKGEILDLQPSNYGVHSNLRMVKPSQHLGYFSTGSLILNKMLGTGIFVTPATVLAISGSKGISIILWLIGGLISWAGLVIYLEYGIRFPLTGGELHYIDFVWQRPKSLFTYMYSIMYVLLSGSQANALIFGQSVLLASTPVGAPLDERLSKFFAVLLAGVVCQLQAVSRINYIRFSNVFAIYKLGFLSVVTVLGWCALGSRGAAATNGTNQHYGVGNFQHSFRGTTSQPYAISLAILDIMRVYSGYENANFVLEEVRRPSGDETRVFRQSAKATIFLVCFFYLMVNVSLFAACSKEELLSSPDVLSLFFTKVFGPSAKTRTASGILLAASSAGNVMSTTFAAVRVKQEIARAGILPFPAFWAKTTRLDTPGPALLLHWIFSVVVIILTPLDNANGYLVFSTLYNYAKTVVGAALAAALLCAPWRSSFASESGEPWRPQSSRSRVGRLLVFPLAALYVFANLFVFIVSWFPASMRSTMHTKERVVPPLLGPVVVIACFGGGAIYWLWDLRIAPTLGYRTEALQEALNGLDVQMSFNRHITGFAASAFRALMSITCHFRRIWIALVGVPDEPIREEADEDPFHQAARLNRGT